MPEENKIQEQEEQLSEEQVNLCLNYFETFNQYYNSGYSYLNNRFYTPNLVNAQLQNINMNPRVPTEKDIQTALENPKTSEQILRDYATFFEITNHFYKRLLSFNADLLSWNLTFDCYNAKDADYRTAEFQEDMQIVDDFCSRFEIKNFRQIVYQILRQGVYFGVFRDEADIYCWQELPADYCIITGNSNVGKLFDFNFNYFLTTSGANIDMYPKIFKKFYLQIMRQMGKQYDPSGDINKRHSSFIYNINVSPADNFFCFDLNNSINTLVPYYSSLFADMQLQPLMRRLEKDKAMISAQKLLMGIIDTYDKAQSGTVPNQMKITPDVMGKFLSLARQALDRCIGITALPVKDAKVVDFSVENQNRYTSYQRNLAANSVSSSASMLTENKLNQFESELALSIDENFVKGLYSQFEAFLNYYINRRTKKFKFKFRLSDTNSRKDKRERQEAFKTYAQMGIVDLNLYARATDQNIFQAARGLKLSKSFNIENDLIALQSLNNQTAEEKNGRPADEDTLNDSTAASKERGSDELAE